jgi:prepilin-type N-terminal cleavage/methylation domain-containing protein
MLRKKIDLYNRGFTVVELLVVIVIISILVGIILVTREGWQARSAESTVKSDLLTAMSSMNSAKNFGNAYPTAFPSNLSVSDDVVLELTAVSNGTACINAYHSKQTGIRRSVISSNPTTVRSYLCAGAGIATLGGSIPPAPKSVDLDVPLSEWTRSGTTTYSASTGELTLGTNGTAISPLIRVNGAAAVDVDATLYATVQSAQASLQPYGGWHVGVQYYAANGTTSVNNSAGYASNGCVRQVTLSSWNSSRNGVCAFALGTNVIYMRMTLYSSASGYASSNLKVKSPSLVLR